VNRKKVHNLNLRLLTYHKAGGFSLVVPVNRHRCCLICFVRGAEKLGAYCLTLPATVWSTH
jgi:hypothetical protein